MSTNAVVEIDTFWNVKSGKAQREEYLKSRNRYILECKATSKLKEGKVKE